MCPTTEPLTAVNGTLAKLTSAIETLQKPHNPVQVEAASNDTLLKLTMAVETLTEKVARIDNKVEGLTAEPMEQLPSTPKKGDVSTATLYLLSIRMVQLLGTDNQASPATASSPTVVYNADDDEEK